MMRTVIRFYPIVALACGLFTAMPALAQECNVSIPLKTPTSQFTIHGDGTVTNNRTGLMWKQCLAGQSGEGCTGTATRMTWSEALTYGANHSFSDYTDWRVPNIKELASIVETACDDPMINLAIFPNDPDYYYYYVWTASPYAEPGLGFAWIVDFRDTFTNAAPRDGSYYVRLVRSGQ